MPVPTRTSTSFVRSASTHAMRLETAASLGAGRPRRLLRRQPNQQLKRRKQNTIRTSQGLGFVQPAGADIGLEDFSMGDEAMTDEMFQQQCRDEREQVLLSETRKLTLEEVRESARKEAAERHALKLKDSLGLSKSKSTRTFGSTKKKIDYDVDDRSGV